jgi:hypothetical protein
MPLAQAFLDDEDPDSAFSRVVESIADNEEAAMEAYGEIADLVVVIKCGDPDTRIGL